MSYEIKIHYNDYDENFEKEKVWEKLGDNRYVSKSKKEKMNIKLC